MSARREDVSAASDVGVALETSSALGSVAVASGGEVLARAFLDRRGRHAAELVPALARVMEEAGVARGDVGWVAVGGGPGSFTGVRIAAATAKGLASALGVPLYAYSSLASAAVAEWVVPDAEGPRHPKDVPGSFLRHVLFDARGDRVYGACYAVAEEGITEVSPPAALRIGDVLDGDVAAGTVFVGDGALRHEALLVGAGHRVLPAPAGIPTADGLVWLRWMEPGAGRVEAPDRWEPDYLRGSTPAYEG